MCWLLFKKINADVEISIGHVDFTTNSMQNWHVIKWNSLCWIQVFWIPFILGWIVFFRLLKIFKIRVKNKHRINYYKSNYYLSYFSVYWCHFRQHSGQTRARCCSQKRVYHCQSQSLYSYSNGLLTHLACLKVREPLPCKNEPGIYQKVILLIFLDMQFKKSTTSKFTYFLWKLET